MRNLTTLIFFILFTAEVLGQNILLDGTISAENNNIVNVADPIDNYDATNKRYVDNSCLLYTSPSPRD